MVLVLVACSGEFLEEFCLAYCPAALSVVDDAGLKELEHEAPPGGVLISYETFAHVKDEIHCEPRGEIRVKGLAYPVVTYGVIDLKARAAVSRPVIRAELPHLKLEVNPELMSPVELGQALAALREAVNQLSSSH